MPVFPALGDVEVGFDGGSAPATTSPAGRRSKQPHLERSVPG
jgi:hypothetical protein